MGQVNITKKNDKKPQKLFAEAMYRINAKESLGPKLAYDVFYEILNMNNNEKHRDTAMGSFLTGLLCNNVSVDEIKAIIKAVFDFEGINLNKEKIKINTNKKIVSILGSGKKGLKTFNISTSSALVASSCGGFVAKIGSSSTSSISGSSDILNFLGANLKIEKEKMIKIIENLGFGFFPIEGIIPKFDNIYGGKFYAPHALSYILPALISPIKLDGILYGLAGPNIEKTAELLSYYGFDFFSVVSSTQDNIHYIDEISGLGKTQIIRNYNNNYYKGEINPLLELGLSVPSYKDIQQGNNLCENSKKLLDSISLSGDINKNNVVAINASELLCLSGLAENIKEGYEKAINSIKSNKPTKLLKDFIDSTGGQISKSLNS